MNLPTTPRQDAPAVVIHGLAHASAALAPGLPVLLLSAPGAALSAGCLWWRSLIETARTAHPNATFDDILDCADAPGLAMSALRIGQRRLILWPSCPAWQPVHDAAASICARVDPSRPPALDLATLALSALDHPQSAAARRLQAHLKPTRP